MEFECFFEKDDSLFVTNEYCGIKFEIKGKEPVLYLPKQDLPKLIKHLQSLEEENK